MFLNLFFFFVLFLTSSSRVIELPLAFRDKWTLESIQKYKNSIRAEAPYVPDNVQFVATNNGIYYRLFYFLY